ncbi:hypothetical protein HON71_03575 [Candidatus Woesearchaeota archaeon]|nr:hypothetical protein [Candidatus Woesearchaeota archaeon]MBT5342396.1 hypothetical protein [Candidatus Woesearchaeota archaeon]
MSYKKNIRFKVEAKTGQLVRKFNVKLVIHLDQEYSHWLGKENPKKEFKNFCNFLKDIFSISFELILKNDSQIFEKIYSSKFNLDITIYTKNEKEGKEIAKFPYVDSKFKKNKIYFNPDKDNLFFIYPTRDLLSYYNHYNNSRMTKEEIISQFKIVTFHEITHVLDPLTQKRIAEGVEELNKNDTIRAEGLATFQNAIHDPKEVIYISEHSAFHKQVKKYFNYNFEEIKKDPYYFGLYMCLVMFTYFVKKRNKVLYEQLYQVIFSGNPNYQILLAELNKDKTKALAATFRQIIAQQDAKTFFKKFYKTAIVLELNLACLPEIKDWLKN